MIAGLSVLPVASSPAETELLRLVDGADLSDLAELDTATLGAEARWHREQAQHYHQRALFHWQECGRRLLALKARLEHGQWLPALRDQVQLPERTAQEMMRLARNPLPVADLLGVQPDASVRMALAALATPAPAAPPERTWPAPIPRPLSVVETDQEALVTLLGIHAVPEPRILDVTANRGVMWRGVPYQPHRLDRDPGLFEQGFTDTVADFRALPFEPASWDVLVFDPPHLSDSGHDAEHAFAARYGLAGADLHGHDSVSHLFGPFLDEAKRVLVAGGVVLAKVADQVHQGRYQAQHIDFVIDARARGFALEDIALTVHPERGTFNDPRWQRVLHVRSIHCYWLVIRKESTDGGR